MKREKYSSNSQFKTLTSEISGMSTNIKNLEEKLEVKVKDDACKEFKVAKANAEKRLNFVRPRDCKECKEV